MAESSYPSKHNTPQQGRRKKRSARSRRKEQLRRAARKLRAPQGHFSFTSSRLSLPATGFCSRAAARALHQRQVPPFSRSGRGPSTQSRARLRGAARARALSSSRPNASRGCEQVNTNKNVTLNPAPLPLWYIQAAPNRRTPASPRQRGDCASFLGFPRKHSKMVRPAATEASTDAVCVGYTLAWLHCRLYTMFGGRILALSEFRSSHAPPDVCHRPPTSGLKSTRRWPRRA